MTDIPKELTDEEILQKAEEIKTAQEAKKAEELRKAGEIKKAEEEQKAEELKRARDLVEAEEERKNEKAQNGDANKEVPAKKSHKGLKIFGIILLLLIIFAGVVFISADVTITAASDKNYAYDTSYNVWIPLDKELNLGGYKVIALASGNDMMISLGGKTSNLVVNQITYVPDQIGTLTLFWGHVTVMQLQYEVALTYLGNTNANQAAFRMVISSDQQLPEFLISFFLSKSGVSVASI